jgi:CubicO group peptidase (beta-lactamase class C family)
VTQPPRADTADRLLHAVAEAQSGTRQPSLVAGVVRDGELVWSAARGNATGGPEPGPDLQYRIGSITKSLTAVTVLQCRDEGLVDLADPVGAVLGDVPFAATSVRQLLSHTGGLPAEPSGPWWERHNGGDFAELTGRIAAQHPVVPASREQHYSNLGYGLLGQLVARLRGKPWLQVFQERVLDPLGMTRTTYAPQPPHATGYSVHPWSGRLDPEPHTDTGAMAPAGQLWSTVVDLARFAAFWLDPDPAVLGPGTVREMRIAVGGRADDGFEGSYGLGLSLTQRPRRTFLGHGGSMPGFLAGFAVDPRQGTAAVALSNGSTGDTPSLPYELLDVLAECEPGLATAWQPERELPSADELLGPWFWGNTPMTLMVRDGWLVLDSANPARRSRFEPAGSDRWRGMDQYFTGETLEVVRDSVGAVHHLDLATYELTRTPYGR